MSRDGEPGQPGGPLGLDPRGAPRPQRTRAHRRGGFLESREEILIGEVIAALADTGYPVVGITADVDFQRIRFLALDDAAIHAVVVAVNRIPPSSTQAALEIEVEARDGAESPAAMLASRANFARRARERARPGIALRLAPGALFAVTTRAISVQGLIDGPRAIAEAEIARVLAEAIASLRAAVAAE